jgi:hypothetical protein
MTSIVERVARPAILIALAIWCAVCLVVAGPTKDKGGLEGAISWVTFVGFWAGLVAFVALGLVLLVRRVAVR